MTFTEEQYRKAMEARYTFLSEPIMRVPKEEWKPDIPYWTFRGNRFESFKEADFQKFKDTLHLILEALDDPSTRQTE